MSGTPPPWGIIKEHTLSVSLHPRPCTCAPRPLCFQNFQNIPSPTQWRAYNHASALMKGFRWKQTRLSPPLPHPCPKLHALFLCTFTPTIHAIHEIRSRKCIRTCSYAPLHHSSDKLFVLLRPDTIRIASTSYNTIKCKYIYICRNIHQTWGDSKTTSTIRLSTWCIPRTFIIRYSCVVKFN